MSKIPDNVVYSEENGYNANVLAYATSVGAPAIKMDNVIDWKNKGVRNVNKEFETKFNELKVQYEELMLEYEWNEIVYNAKFSFEPVIGEIYHLYLGKDGANFLSLIDPASWNKEHIGSFKLNSNKKWIHLDSKDDNFF
ncbi:DUF2452 domain-containing protein [Flavobacterium ardleyense]|uniref:DUF2452 domain-containing protein n=1 Tax=Flavobacterium ardleyense TaxID=2038737 RepID=A0ABW5ZBT4_9FLAO